MKQDIRDLCKRRFGTLYGLDEQGHLTKTLSLPPRPAPLFHGMVFEGGSLCRSRADVATSVRLQIEAKLSALSDNQSITPEDVADLEELVASEEAIWFGPLFVFDEVPQASDAVIEITIANKGRLQGALAEWTIDVEAGLTLYGRAHQGEVVSICASSRDRYSLHEAGVDTLETWRGRGFAGDAVAAWARAVFERGDQPLYSTSHDNLASQRVAQKLGLRQVATDVRIG